MKSAVSPTVAKKGGGGGGKRMRLLNPKKKVFYFCGKDADEFEQIKKFYFSRSVGKQRVVGFVARF